MKELIIRALKSVLPKEFASFLRRTQILISTNSINKKLNKNVKKDKIKIVFIISRASVWTSLKSVYEKALKNPKYEPFILAHPWRDKDESYEYLSKIYDKNVINARQNDQLFDLESFKPDFVFYTIPYNDEYEAPYRSTVVKNYAKICWIVYGYPLSAEAFMDITHNFTFMADTSFTFPVNKSFEKLYKSKLKFFNFTYPKLEFMGFSRFDLIKKFPKNLNPKTILWTPRWTNPNEKLLYPSSFLELKDEIIAFMKENQAINLIIRPHPLMFGNFIKNGIMKESEVDDFKELCAALPNVELDEGKEDYLKVLERADIFFSDFSSLLVEFFVTTKPIIIYNFDNSLFIDEGNIMYNALYKANNCNDAKTLLKSLLSGNDEGYENRLKAIDEFLGKSQNSVASDILEFLQKDYYKA